MRLFKRRTSHHGLWRRDNAGRAFASHGRFRLTINGADERWFYRVTDMRGELPAVDSSPFPSEQETLRAAQAELEENADQLPAPAEY